MNYQTQVATHNTKVRLLLFFLRPMYVFNVVLLAQMWNYLSYSPSTFQGFFGRMNAVQASEWLWKEEFSSYVGYFILVAILEILYQEFLPVIKQQ